MVAISLYRGNLHRVPDIPRRWLMPTQRISLKDFKSLLNRRFKSLSRIRSSSATTAAVVAVAAVAGAATSNPNPKETVIKVKIGSKLEEFQAEKGFAANPKEGEKGGTSKGGGPKEDVKDHGGRGLDGGDCSEKHEEVVSLVLADDYKAVKRDELSNSLVVKDNKGIEAVAHLPIKKPDDELANPYEKETGNAAELNVREKRKKEIEEKLKVLNAKKHNLVQVLKQILNVEEELKRRNSVQGTASRPTGPLQVDVSNDSGSMTRHVITPRTGVESNIGADVEGVETEDVLNQNIHSRHRHRMSSTSPSSESPLRRPPYIQYNAVTHPSRSALGATVSPSRFAPTGNQGHPANVPAVSGSGTNYIASSPSPAASGGTSAFRDARQPSPWN